MVPVFLILEMAEQYLTGISHIRYFGKLLTVALVLSAVFIW